MNFKIPDLPLILLAGGKSSRMGIPKGLLDYRGNLWLLEHLRRFKEANGGWVIVVLGFHHEQYFEKIPWLRTAENQPVHQLGLEISVVINPNPEYGQFSSLQSAISILPIRRPCSEECSRGLGVGSADPRSPTPERFFRVPGAFVLPVDVPGPCKIVYQRLLGALEVTTAAVVPRFQLKGGHPVLLSGAFLERLAAVSPASDEARLDLQIKTLPGDQVASVPVDDEGICLNMNFQKEFKNYRQKS
jgi:CTP:molybdopterin cytidylyltransferase MocA